MKRLINGVVAAAIAATPLAVMGANQDYAEALHLSTKYFGGQRCGNTQSWIHGECHGGDANIDGVDLSGGWHDCGDHVKFGQTNGYAAALLLHSYINYPSSFKDNYSQANSAGSSNNIPDVLDEVKIYTDYALKALTSDGKLYFQVGNAKYDHESCSSPEYQTQNEPSGNREGHYATTNDGAANIAGINAAVLSMMYTAYKDIDASYAEKCLAQAKKYFEFGDANHSTQSSVGPNGNDDGTYVDETWADEMALGAISLYRATKDNAYVDKLNSFVIGNSNYNLPTSWVLDYPTVSPLVAYDVLATVDSDNSSQLDSLRKEMDAYLGHEKLEGLALFGNDNGTLWGSSKYASAAAYMSLLFYNLTGDVKYKEFGQGNIDFLLGDHSGIDDAVAGYSFLSGYGATSPNEQIGQSAAANLQGTNWDTWNNNYGTYNNPKHLIGALVGGVADVSEDNNLNVYFKDDRSDYYTMEVCIYYNAPFVASVAALINLKDGVPNSAPTDIMLNSTSISSGQEASVVSKVKTIDRNLGDNHTVTLLSGGDNFEVVDNTLKTKGKLEEGSYTVKLKSTDGSESIEKEFTIKAVKGNLPNNALYDLGWYGLTDDAGSKLNGKISNNEPDKSVAYGDLFADGVIKATFEMSNSTTKDVWADIVFDTVKVDADGNISETGEKKSFADVASITIEYKSDKDFKLVLPLPKELTGYDDYFVALPNTEGSLKTRTFELNNTVFKQEGWGDATDFNKSIMYNAKVSPAFKGSTGTIQIETFVIEGFKVPTAITDPTVGHKTITAGISEFSPKSMKITVPSNGVYDINVYSLAGRMIFSTSANLSTNGTTLPWDGSSISAGMVLVEVSGNSVRSVTKAMLK